MGRLSRSRIAQCAEPGCPRLIVGGGRCARHGPTDNRPSAARRGYGSRWAANSRAFLKANPNCLDCGGRATVSDHAPLSRRELVARGTPNPDAWEHLQPRCASCHGRVTADYDGAWGNPKRPRPVTTTPSGDPPGGMEIPATETN